MDEKRYELMEIQVDAELLEQLKAVIAPMGLTPEMLAVKFFEFCVDPATQEMAISLLLKWKAEQEGRPTIRGQIKDELDEIIKCSYTYEQFWKILKQRGYKIKRDVKYIALKPAFSQRYIRLKSLGENYSEEAIRQRIIAIRNGIRI